MKDHPHQKGPGMAYFEKPHWQKKIEDTMVADGKYCGEMDAVDAYKKDVDALAKYCKTHKAQH